MTKAKIVSSLYEKVEALRKERLSLKDNPEYASIVHMEENIWRAALVKVAIGAGYDPKYAVYGELKRL